MNEKHIKKNITFKYNIVGVVQKVGFRSYVKKKASLLKLKGSVWNNPDLSVTVVASGDLDSLNRLEHFLNRGPIGSEVKALKKVIIDDPIYYEEFKIIY